MSPTPPKSPVPFIGVRDAEEPSGRVLLERVSLGVKLAEDGMFDVSADLLDDTHLRLRRHPVARSAPVLPAVLVNLGLSQILCGRFSQARDHLAEARALSREHGLELLGLVAVQNLGCLDLARGDIPSALTTFLGLAHRLPRERREALHVDLAEALLAEGMVEEAARTLADGPWSHGRSAQASTLLVEAKLCLLRGDRFRSVELARRVRGAFGRGSLWHGLATRLERTASRRAPSPVGSARTSLEIRLPLAAASPPPPLAAAHRVLDALEAAVRAPVGRGAPVPGPWLTGAAGDAHVARAGLECALAAGDPATALEWTELDRFADMPRTRVPDVLTDRYRAALARGQGNRASIHALRWERTRRRAALAGAPVAVPPAEPVAGRLLERLGDRAFLRLTRSGQEAVALVAAAGRVHARPLGPLPRVARALARLTLPRPLPGTAEPPVHGLLAPVLPLIGERPLVAAADTCLGDPPWGALPDLRGRPVTMVPDARFWLRRSSRPLRALDRVLLAAPGEPPGALAEATALASVRPGALLLTGENARCEDVLAALGTSDLAHLAGHGRVPERAPMLSSVGMSDGPLLACDLSGPASAPEVVVLSACWTGRLRDLSGAPLGFAGALLGAGTRMVVACPAPVRDAGTGAAMLAFHRDLAAGVPVPEAVAARLGNLGFSCLGA
ncbi:CHAT domain-containing protein [Nocardiopsis algeriensis]|uniref:CHAT domain-containing protein n=1 Tax=Nocardiopsis algeriensis TaxID=1478215 RepID=UPI003B43595B